MSTLSPVPWLTFLDDDGSILAGGKLYTYVPGTTTPKTTHSDVALSTPNANPIILDAAGRCVVYLADGNSYKYTLRRSDDTLVRTQDDIPASNFMGAQGLGEFFSFGGSPESPVTSASYTAGGTYTDCHAGTGIWSIDPDDLPTGTYIIEGMVMLDGAGPLVGLGKLVNLDGNPAGSIAEISSSSTVGVLAQSAAFAPAALGSGGSPVRFGIKTRVGVAAGAAYLWNFKIIKVS